MSAEERKDFNKEKKAYPAITMCLPKDVLSCFKNQETSYDLWEAIAKRFGANDQLKKSRKDLLKKQFDLFDHMKNESFDELISRFSHLICELKELGVEYDNIDINEKLLDFLPSNWEVRVMMLKENEEMSTWSLEDIIGKLQAYNMDMKRKAAGKVQVQDPSLYSDTTNKDTNGGIAFFFGQDSLN